MRRNALFRRIDRLEAKAASRKQAQGMNARSGDREAQWLRLATLPWKSAATEAERHRLLKQGVEWWLDYKFLPEDVMENPYVLTREEIIERLFALVWLQVAGELDGLPFLGVEPEDFCRRMVEVAREWFPKVVDSGSTMGEILIWEWWNLRRPGWGV